MTNTLEIERKCIDGHPFKIFSEGYAYCYDDIANIWFLWRFSPPNFITTRDWFTSSLIGADKRRVIAWIYNKNFSDLDTVISTAKNDIAKHRAAYDTIGGSMSDFIVVEDPVLRDESRSLE